MTLPAAAHSENKAAQEEFQRTPTSILIRCTFPTSRLRERWPAITSMTRSSKTSHAGSIDAEIAALRRI